MKKTIALGLLTLVAACAGQPKETASSIFTKKAQPLSSTRKWKLKAKNRKCP